MMIKTVKTDRTGMIKTQDYLLSQEINTHMKKLLFKMRSFNLNVKSNFQSIHEEDMTCRICKRIDSFEDEEHSLSCPVLLEDSHHDPGIKFTDIFGDIQKQIRAR